MNKKHIAIALVLGAVIGAAYYAKIRALPVVGALTTKLPGASA